MDDLSLSKRSSGGSERSNQAIRVTVLSVVAGVFLSAFKFIAGILGNSAAMIADAVHSLSDLISDIVLIFAFVIVRKPTDTSHNYGHGKFETLSTLFVSVALIFAGIAIAWQSVNSIRDIYDGVDFAVPNYLALAGAAFSILIKEVLYFITLKKARELKSDALRANAWHHHSDALTSIAALIGIGGAIILGDEWVILDPLAAGVVSIFIIWAGIGISREAIGILLDQSLGSETHDRIVEIVSQAEGIHNPHDIRTRKIGMDVAIEMHVRIDAEKTVKEAHDLVKKLENMLFSEFGENSFVTIHMDPHYDG